MSFLAVTLIVKRLPLQGTASTRRPGPRFAALRDRRYVSLSAVNCLLCAYYSLLVVGIPLVVLERTRAPASTIGVLLVVNTVVVVIAQVRFANVAGRPGGAARAFRLAGFALGSSCLLTAAALRLTTAGTIALLTTAVIALTVGEMAQQAASWHVSYALAPAERQSEYLAVFGLGTSVERMLGPAVVAAFVVGGGWQLWTVAAVAFVAAGLAAAQLTAAATNRARLTGS